MPYPQGGLTRFYLGINILFCNSDGLTGGTREIGVAILYVVPGIILGAVGQGARAIIGVKKAADEAAAKCQTWIDEWFDTKRLLFSLIVGGIAGCLAAIVLTESPFNKEMMLGLVAAGYAGTDFIEGLMSNYTPPAESVCPNKTEKKAETEEKPQ